MKKNRLIFYLIFALFHIGAFIFTVALGSNSSFLISMFSWVPYFKWVTLLGVLLVVVDFVWASIATKDSNREKSALSHEINSLKAKMFDLQEQVAKDSGQRPMSPPPAHP